LPRPSMRRSPPSTAAPSRTSMRSSCSTGWCWPAIPAPARCAAVSGSAFSAISTAAASPAGASR
jgi:hypothetical protein